MLAYLLSSLFLFSQITVVVSLVILSGIVNVDLTHLSHDVRCIVNFDLNYGVCSVDLLKS